MLLQTLMPYLADKIGTSAEGPHTRSASWASHSQVADQTPAAQPHFASIGQPPVSSLQVTLRQSPFFISTFGS